MKESRGHEKSKSVMLSMQPSDWEEIKHKAKLSNISASSYVVRACRHYSDTFDIAESIFQTQGEAIKELISLAIKESSSNDSKELHPELFAGRPDRADVGKVQ